MIFLNDTRLYKSTQVRSVRSAGAFDTQHPQIRCLQIAYNKLECSKCEKVKSCSALTEVPYNEVYTH
jgi:hypothetical protein